MQSLNLKGIIERILDARTEGMLRERSMPNMIYLSPRAAAELCLWLFLNRDKDPMMGYSPINHQLLGMTFIEDKDARVDIVCKFVES